MPGITLIGPKFKDLDKKRIMARETNASVAKAFGLPTTEVGAYFIELDDTCLAPAGVLACDELVLPEDIERLPTKVLIEVACPPIDDMSMDIRRNMVTEIAHSVEKAYDGAIRFEEIFVRFFELDGSRCGNSGIMLGER